MSKKDVKRLLLLNIPYVILGLVATNIGEAWRLAEGADFSAKLLGFFAAFPLALSNPMPSFHPTDLLVGMICGAGLRLAVYIKGKNAKKFRHNVEYGSARWGTAKDIHHLKMVIAFCRKPLAGSLMISTKVFCSNHPEEATLPLRCLATATPLWTCRR